MLIPLRRRPFLWFCAICLVLLNIGNALSLVARYHYGVEFGLGVVPLFNLDREANFPTLFNGGLLVFAAMLAFAIGREAPRIGLPFRRSWIGLAAILAFLALDELCGIHDTLDVIIEGRVEVSGPVNWPWVIPYAVLAVVVGAIYIRFFFGMPGPVRVRFAITAGMYVFGAIGMEMVGADRVEKIGGEDMIYGLCYTLEENLEIIACILACDTLHGIIRDRFTRLDLGLRIE